MIRDSERRISVAIKDTSISNRLSAALTNTEYVPLPVDIAKVIPDGLVSDMFCFAVDSDALTDISADAVTYFESIQHRNPNVGIILLTTNTHNSDYHKLLHLDNVLVADCDASSSIFSYQILSFLGILHKADINSSVSQYISSDVKIYSLPNDLQLVRPVTEHLIRDLLNMGIVTTDELFNVKFGVQEMIVNAIEHGNLGITYEEKSGLLTSGEDIGAFIRRRAANPEYADRKVTIKYTLTQGFVKYVIRDEGAGFNHRDIPLEITDENFESIHGRGIIMSRGAFDEFHYNDAGNEITMVIYKK